jgi:hypothetical protein
MLVGERPVPILAVHYFRLVGMQLQPDFPHPVRDSLPQPPGLALADAVHNTVVRLCGPPDYVDHWCGMCW